MNFSTLNTISLDDGKVIIKRGGSGGGATINNQSKVVDITENGTTEVVPDSGFTGLSKVEVNVNVSGGSGGGELEGEYYLARPNGWYWRLIKVNTNSISPDTTEWEDYTNAISLPIETFAIYDQIYQGALSGSMLRYSHDRATYINGQQVVYIQQKKSVTPIWALSERECEVSAMKFPSLYEFIKTQQPMTEAEFEAFMLEMAGLQRITKEEYESLITA